MTLANVLNVYFGSMVVIVLIITECIIRYSNNRSSRKYFLTILIITLFFLIMDMIFSILDISFFTISVKLVWPAAAALLLFIYLFKITNGIKIDSLTGLNNRYNFFEYTSGLSRKKNMESWYFIVFDIDNFKSINNIYGYIEGDNALRSLAKILIKCTDKTDFTARYGGDEFIIVTKADTNVDDLITGIKIELEKHNVNGKKPYNIEINHGYAKYTSDGNNRIDEVLKYIDSLMKRQTEANRRANDKLTGSVI